MTAPPSLRGAIVVVLALLYCSSANAVTSPASAYLDFTGSTSHVSTTSFVWPPGDFTLAAWFRQTESGMYVPFSFSVASTGSMFAFAVIPGVAYGATSMFNNHLNLPNMEVAATVAVNEWVHLAVSVSYDSNIGSVFFINGQSVKTGGSPTGNMPNPTCLALGDAFMDACAMTGPFGGGKNFQVKQLALYNYAMDASEVAAQMAAVPTSSDTGIVSAFVGATSSQWTNVLGSGHLSLGSSGITVVPGPDGCPSDPNKIAAGACGCGTSDVDTDGDGALDNCAANGEPQDDCINDPNKTSAGTCGCGNSEADADGDGTPDCVDDCVSDPDKTAAGICGCLKSDDDSDSDGAYDDCAFGGEPQDGCPNDSAKVEPGQCGCGNPDTDTDGDGVADCNDPCGNGVVDAGEECDDGNLNEEDRCDSSCQDIPLLTCADNPCGVGMNASSCVDVNTTLGEYTCTCYGGHYGSRCLMDCPTGYMVNTDFSPAQCIAITAAAPFNITAQGACPSPGVQAILRSNADVVAAATACGSSCNLAATIAASNQQIWYDGSTTTLTSTATVGSTPIAKSSSGSILGNTNVARPQICSVAYLQCSNGVQDGTELDVDCGGLCGVCPPVVTVSTGSTSMTQRHPTDYTIFTFTFSEDVTGFDTSNVAAAAAGPGVLSFTDITTVSPSVYVVNGSMSYFGPGAVNVTMFIGTGTNVRPAMADFGNRAWVYFPYPVPVMSSSLGADGASVGTSTLTFTATFDYTVPGLTTDDFEVLSGAVGQSLSLASSAGGMVYVLTVTLQAPLVTTPVVVSVKQSSTAAYSGSDPFTLMYHADPCLADPCNIAAGVFSTACTPVDNVAGTFTCTCKTGKFGPLCDKACPPGANLITSVTPGQCSVSQPVSNFETARSTCLSAGGDLASVHSADENTAYSLLCAEVVGATAGCWLGANDTNNEGVWTHWVDGTPITYTNWKGVNPDNANNIQDCMMLQADGLWDDRNCAGGLASMCRLTDFSICSNGVMDEDAGENGIDCGGYCVACPAVTVLYSSMQAQNGTVVRENVLKFTATFGNAVKDVAIADFGLLLPAGPSVTTTLVQAQPGTFATRWVLNVTFNADLATGNVRVRSMPASNGAILPVNLQGTADYWLTYDPPKPVLSAASMNVQKDTFKITATFSSAVSGVEASHFGITSGVLTLSTSVAAAHGTTKDTTWVLTVRVTDGFAAQAITFTALPEKLSGVMPWNQAGDSNLVVNYASPTVAYSAAFANGGAFHTTKLQVTATFSTPVSNVTVADFGMLVTPALNLTAATVKSVGVSPVKQWVYSVDIKSRYQDADFTFPIVGTAQQYISPRLGASPGSFVALYRPPTATLTSSATTSDSPVLITATFSSAVTGFNLNAVKCSLDSQAISMAPSFTGSGTTYVLALSTVQGVTNTTIMCSLTGEAAGSISPVNAAGGAVSVYYNPPTVVLSSDATTVGGVMTVTATFSEPVTGVAANQLMMSSSPSFSPSSVTVSGSGAVYVFSVTLPPQSMPAALTFTYPELAGATPENRASAPLGVALVPPTCTVSSSSGPIGTQVASNTLTYTATFSSAVSGLTQGDVQVSSTSAAVVSHSVAAVGSQPSTQYIITVNMDATSTAAGLVHVTVPAMSTQPSNQVSPAFALLYKAPGCNANPCAIGTGLGIACTDVDTMAGTYTCTCPPNRYGDGCLSPCPVGWSPVNSFNGPVCAKLGQASTWDNAQAGCANEGAGSVVGRIYNSDQNAAYRTMCATANPMWAGNCWIGANDKAQEGKWVWQGTDEPVSYSNWKGINPDNAIFGGNVDGQDCAMMLSTGLWDDRACPELAPPVCEQPLGLCSNGVQDADIGETGVDCGGPCTPCSVSALYSSSLIASGGTTGQTHITFTATFDYPVTGITVADFGLTSSAALTYSTSLATHNSNSATRSAQWVLTVAISAGWQPAALAVAAMSTNQGSITPPMQAMADSYIINYLPISVTLSSDLGASSTRVDTTTVSFTATFSKPVTGLSTSDMPVTVGAGTITTNTITNLGGAGLTWVRIVTFTVPSTVSSDVPVTASLGEDVTTPYAKAAANGPFVINYVPPPCNADPCNLGDDRFASACVNGNSLAGTFTCTCFPGRYGATCTAACPTGATLRTDRNPSYCSHFQTSQHNWQTAESLCVAQGGHMASIHNAAQNVYYRSLCDTISTTQVCWLGASDLAVEGTFVWTDGSTWDYHDWLGINPDNNQAFGGQHCLTQVADGKWDDRSCSVPQPSFCDVPFGPSGLCHNGKHDADVGEDGVDCGPLCHNTCHPWFTSPQGPSGTVVTAPAFAFELNFNTEHSDVTVADFGLTSSPPVNAQLSLAPAAHSRAATVWTLNVDVSGDVKDSVFKVNLPAGSGLISPANRVAANNNFTLVFNATTAVLSSAQAAAPQETNVLVWTVRFDTRVTGLTASDFTVAAGNLVTSRAVSCTTTLRTTCTFTLTVTDKFQNTDVMVSLPAASVSPANTAAGPVTVRYRPPVPQTGASTQTSTGRAETFTGRITVPFTFTHPVSGVVRSNIWLQTTGGANVTYTVAPVGSEPTREWVVVLNIHPATALGKVAVYLNNTANIQPPPVARTGPVFEAEFVDQFNDPDADGRPKWWVLLIICSLIVGCCVLTYCLVCAKRKHHNTSKVAASSPA